MLDIPKFLADSYSPSNEDILNLRIVTQTISDTIFLLYSKKIHFIDVSGLAHHRKNWVSYFDNVECVLFVVSLSSYDQNLAEDSSINRMVDALVLFEEMANHELLEDKNWVLFLNKKDIYEHKIKVKKIPIVDYFPNYKGTLYSVH
ncbi:hypothetical protein HDU91_001797 [Kappamyces sp. JEL0680]|nr:hypothetical protein HDU91_001797 [Kappamyces sp. JEL0680]